MSSKQEFKLTCKRKGILVLSHWLQGWSSTAEQEQTTWVGGINSQAAAIAAQLNERKLKC